MTTDATLREILDVWDNLDHTTRAHILIDAPELYDVLSTSATVLEVSERRKRDRQLKRELSPFPWSKPKVKE